MDETDRNKTLLELIRQGLEIYGRDQTQKSLGDRSRYIGLSDLARYGECPRAALLSKFHEADSSLETLLALQRGHWFEQGINRSLMRLGLKFIPQLEIAIQHEGAPIRAHLDFTFVWDKPHTAAHVLEVKSTSCLPAEPYESHEAQAEAQINLLYKFWNKPVFGLRNPDGAYIYDRLTFPQICRLFLGVSLPKTPDNIAVESWLLYLSMKDAQAFGPYLPDMARFGETLNLAAEFWNHFQTLKTGKADNAAWPYASGFSLLCGYCQFNADCPKFRDCDSQPQWEETLARLDSLRNSKSALDAEIKGIEARLKQACQFSGVNGWINAGRHRFRVTNSAGRKTLDRAVLREELATIFRNANLDDMDVDALLSRCEREGAPSSRLNIMKLK